MNKVKLFFIINIAEIELKLRIASRDLDYINDGDIPIDYAEREGYQNVANCLLGRRAVGYFAR